LVLPPATGFWRVTDWAEPFSPKEPAPPVGDSKDGGDEAGRFDDPDGEFRTLYCATEPEGALGEKIAAFALSSRVAIRIERFLQGDPDPGAGPEDLSPSLDRETVDSFSWVLAWAPADRAARFIDLWHWRTCGALLPSVARLLARFDLGILLDVHALSDERRAFTRRLAGILRGAATDSNGRLHAAGIRYSSRLPPRWVCWALWEPLALDRDQADVNPVTIDTPALRKAAEMLGVVIRD
jgi:hypothetical protein